MNLGDRFGAHRVIEPAGVLPKAAARLDNQTPPFDNEIGIRVRALHITAAGFNRLWEDARGDQEAFAVLLRSIVEQRGKFQDPLTGSGGVLLGEVDFLGPALDVDLRPGDPVVSMVSLALTPLRIEKIGAVNPTLGQVEVAGYAILFESGLWARLPHDISAPLAMLALDVAGAPAYARRYVQPGQRVLVIGAGKAGLLCLHEARQALAGSGQLLVVEPDARRARAVLSLGLADQVISADASQSLEVFRQVEQLTGGALADLSFDTASAPHTEMAAILSTRDEGTVIFFNMATDFARAALGAEGAGKALQLIIGNGYLPGHARLALDALRENQALRDHFSHFLTHQQDLPVSP
ncbi:MAG TPA: L-erythro-3,5-diaminohexanoate dehydrogenase [Anaerolineales bacterium]